MDNLVNLFLALAIIAGVAFAIHWYVKRNKPTGGKGGGKIPGDPPPRQK